MIRSLQDGKIWNMVHTLLTAEGRHANGGSQMNLLIHRAGGVLCKVLVGRVQVQIT